MSDSETDPDLAVERHDPEDDVNVYGSPISRPAFSDQQPGPSNITVDRPPDRTEVSEILLALLGCYMSNFFDYFKQGSK